MGASGVGVPTGSPGQGANALATVREALKLLEKALPQLPTGSDPYRAVAKGIEQISKYVPPSDEVPGVQKTQLANLQREGSQSAMMQSLMRSMGGAGGPEGGAPGGAQPPAMQ